MTARTSPALVLWYMTAHHAPPYCPCPVTFRHESDFSCIPAHAACDLFFPQ